MRLIKDSENKDSAIRAGFLFLLLIIILTWSWVSISNNKLEHFDPEAVAIVATAFGAKVWQKKIEEKK